MTRQTIVRRLDAAQRTLAVALALRALAFAIVTGAGTLLLFAIADALIGLPLGPRRLGVPLATVAAAVVLLRGAVVSIRPTFTASVEQVALWFEQRIPALRYALVTVVAGDAMGSAAAGPDALTTRDTRSGDPRASLLLMASAAPLEETARSAARAAIGRPLLAAAVGLFALVAVPRGAMARLATPRAGDSLGRPGAAARAAADPLATIVVRVRPPEYTGLPERAIDDPSSVHALAGGRVVVEGRGAGVGAQAGESRVASVERDGRWQITLTVAAVPLGVRLLGPTRERILVIEPIADSVPVARLDMPTRDTVLRVAAGTVSLRAELRDDHGLADAAFEYVVSSGAGETFTFRGGRIAARTFAAGTRSARLDGSFALDTLKLAPGDLVHLRAVARDRNDVTGPGIGASETRTLRIARADEYDSVSVDPMPPTEPEKNALSQRMILQMTQELRARERRIGVEQTTRESRSIAIEQTRLRKRVGEIVFTRLSEDQGEHAHFAGDGHEHGPERPVDPDAVLAAAEAAASVDRSAAIEGEADESPVVAINRPLLEAYNHMWQASTELELGSPRTAIPWMERAIAALQRARAAERIYLRGRPPRVVVDLAKVRGTGHEKGTPSARSARVALDPDREARLARFDSLLTTVASDPLGATDALLLLRLSLPEAERGSAVALTAAAEAVRRGGDVTGALQRARRALAGPPVRSEALGPWGR